MKFLASLWSAVRRWFVAITIFIVVASLLLGGSYQVVVQFLPDAAKQNVTQITFTVGLAVVLANVIVSIMQWVGISPLDLLPERTLKEVLRKRDRNRYILSQSKDVGLLSAQTKVAKEAKQYDWMYLFGESWVARQPAEPDAYEMLGKAQLEIDFLDDAIKTGHKLIALEPLNEEGYSIIGDAYFKQANPSEARIWYEKAREVVSPTREQFVLFDLVKTYEKLGLADEAATAVKALLPLLDDSWQKNYYGEKLQHYLEITARKTQQPKS